MIYDPDLVSMWPNFLFIENLVMIPSHLWTISVEVQFYVLTPFLIHHMNRTNRPFLVPICLIILSLLLNALLVGIFCSEGF